MNLSHIIIWMFKDKISLNDHGLHILQKLEVHCFQL